MTSGRFPSRTAQHTELDGLSSVWSIMNLKILSFVA